MRPDGASEDKRTAGLGESVMLLQRRYKQLISSRSGRERKKSGTCHTGQSFEHVPERESVSDMVWCRRFSALKNARAETAGL